MEENLQKSIVDDHSPEDRLFSLITFFKGFIGYLWMKKFIIVPIVVLIGITGALFNYYQDAKYTASVTFALDDEGGDMGGYGGIAAQFGITLGNGGGGAFKGDNLLELFKTRYIIQQTLLDTGVVNGKKVRYINYFIPLEFPQFKDVVYDDGTRSYRQDSILTVLYQDIIKSKLNVSRIDKRLILVNASFQSKDQYFSKSFIEKLIENVTSFYAETKTRKAKGHVQMMANELDSLKGMMTGAINKSAIVSDLNVNPLRQISRAPVQRSNADAQVYMIAYGEVMKNLELAKLTLLKETPLIQIIDLPVLPLKKEKKGRLMGLVTWGGISFLILLVVFYFKFMLHLRKKQKAKT